MVVVVLVVLVFPDGCSGWCEVTTVSEDDPDVAAAEAMLQLEQK